MRGFGRLAKYAVQCARRQQRTFADFFALVQAAEPDKVSSPEAGNPFPGFLPRERTYARAKTWPPDADPSGIPLLWDANAEDWLGGGPSSMYCFSTAPVGRCPRSCS